MRKLGYDVKILLSSPSRFTWFAYPDDLTVLLDKPIADNVNLWPKCDIIIATGCSTVKKTVLYDLPAKNKFYWIRGYETWSMSEDDLINTYKSGLRLIVNSTWQKQNIFEKCNITPDIIYSGIPIDEFRNIHMNTVKMGYGKKRITIGGLYSSRPHKNIGMLLDIARLLNRRGLLEKLLLLSNELPKINLSDINTEVLLRPSLNKKIEMYTNCDVWVSTSINDGFHIPPAEAIICGTPIVVNGVKSSGTSDYAINEVTAKIYLKPEEACDKIIQYFSNEEDRTKHSLRAFSLLKEKIGDVRENALRFISLIRGQ